MKIEDPNNILPGFFLIGVLPYVLLGIMVYIYHHHKSLYKKNKTTYFIILFFVVIYVLLAALWKYFMGSVAGYKSGLDTVKITL